MSDPAPLYRGPRPTVAKTLLWANRTERLRRDPQMHRLSYGHWFRAEAPLNHLQRSVLLQQHLSTDTSTVRFTGTTALTLLRLPDGSH